MIVGGEDGYFHWMKIREDGELGYDAHQMAHPGHVCHHGYQDVVLGWTLGSTLLGEICLMHIFRSILINSSLFFYNFLIPIYANILLRLFSICLIFFLILLFGIQVFLCPNLPKAAELIGDLCNFILVISFFSFHMVSYFFPCSFKSVSWVAQPICGWDKNLL